MCLILLSQVEKPRLDRRVQLASELGGKSECTRQCGIDGRQLYMATAFKVFQQLLIKSEVEAGYNLA